MNFYLFFIPFFSHLRTRTGPEWGGAGGLDTPGKSQVIYVYLENKQLDPALEKVGHPPPPLANVGPPVQKPWNNIVFFIINYWTFCKIS